MIKELTSYGSGEGLLAWSLVDDVEALDLTTADKLVLQAQRQLRPYGGWDDTKENFAAYAAELVYNTAETLYFWKQQIQIINSPARSERMGSYAYDKGAQLRTLYTREIFVDEMLKHPFIGPLIYYLKDRTAPWAISSRVFQDVDYNPQTGVRDMVLQNYSNRIERAIHRWGLISDTETYNALVYNDPLLTW